MWRLFVVLDSQSSWRCCIASILPRDLKRVISLTHQKERVEGKLNRAVAEAEGGGRDR